MQCNTSQLLRLFLSPSDLYSESHSLISIFLLRLAPCKFISPLTQQQQNEPNSCSRTRAQRSLFYLFGVTRSDFHEIINNLW